MNSKAQIVYFSGTGGTALAAKTLSESLEEIGVTVRITELFRGKAPEPEPDETLILMYPVYAADAPVPIYDWIDSLQYVDNGKASVVSISGGGNICPNTACRAKAVKMLERKGLDVISEYMLCMPSNFIAPTPENIAQELIHALPDKCGRIADEIIRETQNRKKPLFVDRLFIVLFSMEKLGAKYFGNTLKADEACNGCALCAEKCPRGNIVMNGGRPEFGWRCVLCMRCIYDCPKKAIRARLPILKRAAIKEGFDLKSIKKDAQKTEAKKIEKSDVGILWKAVVKYINSEEV